MMPSLARWDVKHENRYTAFDGRLYLERRPALSPNWYARCCHNSKQLYKTTKSPMLSDAQRFAERWFLGIQSRIESGEPVVEPTLEKAYKALLAYHEEDLLKTGKSNHQKIRRYRHTWNNVKRYLADARLSEIDTKKLQWFRGQRQRDSERALTEKTIHADLTLISLILKHAVAQGWLTHLPPFPREQIKHESPDWLTPAEWAALYDTSEQRIAEAENTGNAAAHIRRERQELHAFLLFMTYGCIRVGECLALRWKDVETDRRNDDLPIYRQRVLLRIREGKTGARQGIGAWGVLKALDLLRAVLLPDEPKPDDKLFPTPHRHGMAKLLDAANLRIDAKGRKRNAKTLRHTSIMLRFMDEPEIRPMELAAISGTSAVTLEKYYLRHVTGDMVKERLMKKEIDEMRALAEEARKSAETLPPRGNVGVLPDDANQGEPSSISLDVESLASMANILGANLSEDDEVKPQDSVKGITGFRRANKRTPKDEKERPDVASEETLSN